MMFTKLLANVMMSIFIYFYQVNLFYPFTYIHLFLLHGIFII